MDVAGVDHQHAVLAVVGVGHRLPGLALVEKPQGAGQLPDLVGVDTVDVERRVGHDEVAALDQFWLFVVEAVADAEVTFEDGHGEVHACQVGVGFGLFLTVEDAALVRFGVALQFDEVAGLDEHAAGAAGGVEDGAAVRL